jgi:long-subunit fatty acid transport protein
MKKLIGFWSLLLIFAFPAAAQIAPNIDVSAGYSLRVFQTASGVREGMSGWYGAGDYKIFRWLSAGAEIRGDYRNNGIEGSTSLYTALFGPQFYPFGHRKMTVFGHVLAGEGLYRLSIPPFGGFPSEVDLAWHSAWEAGGGVDYTYSNRWKIRGIEADYGQTTFFGHSENNYMLSIGFVYTFGQK